MDLEKCFSLMTHDVKTSCSVTIKQNVITFYLNLQMILILIIFKNYFKYTYEISCMKY